jgi:unspecific monooxygenase
MSTADFVFDPWSPEVQANPYPIYAELRARNPVCRIPAPGAWAVTRYDDVRTVTNDWKRFSVREGLSVRRSDHHGGNVLVENDPPAHTRARRALQPMFTPKALAPWQDRAQQIADELVDAMLERGGAEIKTEVADPLVTRLMIELLGLPDDRDLLEVYPLWSKRIMEDLDRRPGDPDIEPLHETLAEAYQWFSDLIDERRRHPRDQPRDLIDGILLTRDVHTDEQINQIALTVLAAGLANTAEMLCYGTLGLSADPSQLALLRDDPDGLARRTVEESVRWGSPAHCVYRLVLEDVELSGTVIPSDARVMTLWGSANHDESVFEDPERFDIMRDPSIKHLGWGVGVHRCIGEPIGQLEGVALFRALGRKVATIELDGPPEPYTTSAVRGFERLVVTARAS